MRSAWVFGLWAAFASVPARGAEPVRLQVLALNDFHGNLAAPKRLGTRTAGSAPVLAAWLKDAAKGQENRTLILHAGDLVGASPAESALLQDEPSVTFLSSLGNAACSWTDPQATRCNVVATLGNHEFDEGPDELRRLLHGGNHAGGPYLEPRWRGARFSIACANAVDAATGKPIEAPWVIRRVGGVRIGVIGAVTREVPHLVTPSLISGLRFRDEADAINEAVAALRRRGVHAIVVVIHEGGRQDPYEGPTRDDAPPVEGAIVGIVAKLDPDVDLVVSGHTHAFTNARLPTRGGKALVTQAWSAGAAFADIDLAVDASTRDVVEASARIVTAWTDEGPGLAPDADVKRLVDAAMARVAPKVRERITTAAHAISRDANEMGESPLGDLIADAQRVATGADMAFMNAGGIRTSLEAGDVTWGDLFAVQPFGNSIVRMEMTGAQVLDLLEGQWAREGGLVLVPSGVTYAVDMSAPPHSRVRDAKVTSRSAPLDPHATYTVAVSSFLASGGDGFGVFNDGRNPQVGPSDLDALIAHLRALPQPIDATIDGRIRRAP
jgi:5'-nucleotidase